MALMMPPWHFIGPYASIRRTPRNRCPRGDLKFEASLLDPRLHFVFRLSGGVAGAITTHIDDILGCGEPDPSFQARLFPGKRFGELKVQGKSFAHVGM